MKIKGLTFIFVIALFTTIWINFIDYKFSACVFFTNKTKNVESLLDNFCLSYISGYFFYFINVYLVEREDKKHILPLISEKVYHIILVNKAIIKVMKQDNNFNRFNITLEEFRLLLKKDNFEATNTFLTANGNKVLDKFIKDRRKGTLELIESILKTGKFVDDELKSILFSLQEAQFLRKNYGINSKEFDSEKASLSSFTFYMFFIDIERLNQYYNKNLKKFNIGLHKRYLPKKADI